MKLSARCRYAARILLELAKSEGGAPMSASVLSHRTGVSVQFVEQILKPLKQHGMTSSIRGASGGHLLGKGASEITLGDVVRIMEGGIQLSVCCGPNPSECSRRKNCYIHSAWNGLSQALEDQLDAISLSVLLTDGLDCHIGQLQEHTGKGADSSSAVKRSPIIPVSRKRPSKILKSRAR